MHSRQLLNDDTACAPYLLGCKSRSRFAVVDPHVDLVERYLALAEAQGIPIVAVLETHVQAGHVSTIGFERAHNRALAHDSEDAFVAANRAGRTVSVTR